MKTVVSVIGKDAVGIIADVSAVCSECNANIVDITQSVLQDMFVMVMLTEINDINCSFTEYSDKMKKSGEKRNIDIRVMHEDVFNCITEYNKLSTAYTFAVFGYFCRFAYNLTHKFYGVHIYACFCRTNVY